MPVFQLKETDAYATAKKYHPGVESGLLAAVIGGVSAARSTLNMAEDGAPFVASGAPVVNPKDAVYGSTAWLDTAIAEAADCTTYVICKLAATGRGQFIGNYEVNGPWGTSLYMETNGSLNLQVGTYDGGSGAGVRQLATIAGYAAASLAAAPWRLIRAEVDSTAKKIELIDLTSGQMGTGTPTWTTNVRDLRGAGRLLRIGAGVLANFRNNQQIMALLHYNRVLTFSEKGVVETRLRSLAAYCGAAV